MTSNVLFQCAAMTSPSKVAGFRCREGLSQLYELEIGLLCDDELSDDAMHAACTLQLGDDEAIHGEIVELELLHSWDGQSFYRVGVAPRLFRASLNRHSRVFVDISPIDAIKTVLKESGLNPDIDFSVALTGSYEAQAFFCQYEESNLAFVSRWMERLGLYYFFDHRGERERLVISDAASHETLRSDAIRYVPQGADRSHGTEALMTFTRRRAAQPAEVLYDDYDYQTPSRSLASGATVGGVGTMRVYGDGTDCAALAAVKAEGLLAERHVYRASGSARGLSSGYKFTLDEHPLQRLNQAYLIVGLTRHGATAAASDFVRELLEIPDDASYRVAFRAIEAGCQFRAPQRTPIPRIDGVLSAVIDGPADSAYGQIDDQGRYRIRLKFDESGAAAGNASPWVRMLQSHGGTTEGAHFPLRKGTEVLVVFLGGDPDRPLICGVGHNPLTPSPVTSADHETNRLVSGAGNQLEMRDTAGREYVELSSPNCHSALHLGAASDGFAGNAVLTTSGTSRHIIGLDEVVTIGTDLRQTIGANCDVDIGGEHSTVVGGDQDLAVRGDQSQRISGDRDVKTGGDAFAKVDGDETREIGGSYSLVVAEDSNFDISADHTATYGGIKTETNVGIYNVTNMGAFNETNMGIFNQTNMGAANQTNLGAFNQVNMGLFHQTTFGATNVLNIGPTGNWNASATVEGNLAAKLEFNAAATASISAAATFSAELGAALTIFAGAKAEITLGAAFGLFMGAACDVRIGPKIEVESMAAKTYGLNLSTGALTLKA